MLFKNTQFVLVNTFHPGNIGSAARAIKTMGFDNLTLVNPRLYPHPDASAMAASAIQVFDTTKVASDLKQAIKDCNYVFGASARSRGLAIPVLSAEEAGKLINTIDDSSKIAILFGRERTGLSNEELSYCTHHIYIPASEECGVLNLAQAVQVIAYEIFKNSLEEYKFKTPTDKIKTYPTSEDIKNFEAHLKKTLLEIEFLKPKSNVALKLNAIFRRANPTHRELKMLRGIFTKVDTLLEKLNSKHQ